MYLHIGEDQAVPAARIVGVFDLDHCTCSPRGRAFLSRAEADGLVLDASGKLPRSFVVCDGPYQRQIVWLSALDAVTLRRRWERGGA